MSQNLFSQNASGARAAVRGQRLSVGALTAPAAIAALVALSVLYTQIARTVTVNSDHASIVLEAAAVLHGNPLLHGWTLTNVSFYTLDLPFYVAAIAWQGLTPNVMREVPAVIYALTVLMAVWLAGRGMNRRAPALGRVATFLILGLPSLLVPQVVLVGVDHIATTLVMAAVLLTFDRPDDRPLTGAGTLLVCALCLMLMIGDTIALWVLILPIIGVSIARSRCPSPGTPSEQNKRRELVFLGVGMLSVLAADVSGALMHALGGFSTVPLHVKIVSPRDLPETAFLLARGLLSLFRSNVFEHSGAIVKTATALDLSALLFVLWSLFLALRSWRTWQGGGDRVTQVLGVGMAVNLAGYLGNSAVSNMYNTLYSPPERYLVPFFVFGAILAGRLGVDSVSDHTRLKAGLALLGTAYTVLLMTQLRMPDADPSAARLGSWLRARHLDCGFGNFWCASLVTVASGDTVRIRPVVSDGTLISPLHWFSDEKWYVSPPATFLVYNVAHAPAGNFYWQDIDLKTARNTFGSPSEVDQVGPYTVLVWKKNITAELAR